MSRFATMSVNTLGGVTRPMSAILPAVLTLFGVMAVLMLTSSLAAALAALAGMLFCGFLFTAPPFWIALFLIALSPFQSLINQLLGGWESNGRQLFAVWKEVLLLIGIFRVIRDNQNRSQILRSNRWILVSSGLLVLVYVVTFLRAPSIPAVFSFALETRFLPVMFFFMFLRLDEKRVATLLRLTLWSVGLIAIYGLIQYFWKYELLLPLVYNSPDLYADGVRRLYSYSLNALEPAYGAMIGILVLACATRRSAIRPRILWASLFLSCLLLTYTRSAYIGLIAGLVAVSTLQRDRSRYKRYALIASLLVCMASVLLAFGPRTLFKSNIGERLESIVSQSDQSSNIHKEGMQRAVEVIAANPFGIGLGRYGTVQSRFDPDDAHKTEDWVLQVAVGGGIPGALAYIALTLSVVVGLLRRRRGVQGWSDSVRVAACAAFVAMTIAGLMIPVWDLFLPTVYAWGLVGIGLAARAVQGIPSRER